jgi:uncharacterized membrane protein
LRDESEKEIVHRLEAFSDIVIGFSLAQLGLTLIIPKHSIDLFTHISGARTLIGFGVTFFLVCAVWWAHHRLFRHVFVPTAVNIVANFAALGGVIFLSYSMQVLVHFSIVDRTAYAMYAGSYAWIMLLFAFLWWNGIRLRGDRLTGPLRETSFRFAIRTTIVGVWLAGLAAISILLGPAAPANQVLVVLLIVALALHRVTARRRSQAAINSPSA